MNTKKICILLIITLCSGCYAYNPLLSQYDDYGKYYRGATLEVTGYSVIQSHEGSEPQQRLMAIKAARLDAMRQLAEIVYGTYIDSSTTVSDLTIGDYSIRARVEGVIYDAELIKIEPISNDTYSATLGLPRSSIDDLRMLYMQLIRTN